MSRSSRHAVRAPPRLKGPPAAPSRSSRRAARHQSTSGHWRPSPDRRRSPGGPGRDWWVSRLSVPARCRGRWDGLRGTRVATACCAASLRLSRRCRGTIEWETSVWPRPAGRGGGRRDSQAPPL